MKRLFVQRRALAKFKPEDVADLDAAATEEALLGVPFSELAFARRVTAWQEDEAANAGQLELAARYAACRHHRLQIDALLLARDGWRRLNAARNTMGMPFVIPPRMPPQWFVSVMILPFSTVKASLSSLPRRLPRQSPRRTQRP